MGAQVALKTAKETLELVKLVDEVAKILNTARTCVIEVKNHTKHELKLIDHHHDHGGFQVPPDQRLPPHHAEVFGTQSKSWSAGTGTEGSVTYQIGGGDARVRLRWNVPFAFGGNDTDGTATGGWHGSTSFVVSGIVGAGNDAHAKYELREIGPIVFGEALGKVDAVTMIQSNYGNNFELVARTGDALHFMWREDRPPWKWHGPFRIAGGAAGNPVLIQSNFGKKGNFELVFPDRERGIRFMWRNNDHASMPWSAPHRFAESLGKVDAVTMIQNRNNRNLELFARAGDAAHVMWRENRPSWKWHGPFQIATGAVGNLNLTQSRFGKQGHFELVYPFRERGIRFIWRNNDL